MVFLPRNSGSRRPLDHDLLELDHAQDRERDPVLGHPDHAVHPGAGQPEGVVAHAEHRQAVGQRGPARDGDRFARALRGGEAGRRPGLDPDDLDPRPQRLGRDRDPGEEAGAADRADDGVGVAHLLEHLERHRALAGDDGGVVKTVDVGEAFRRRKLVGPRARLRKIPARHDHDRAQFPAGAHLDERGVVRHHHRDRDAEQLAVIREAQRVVPGRRGDDAALLLPGFQLQERVARAALLEGAGALEVVEFAEDPRPGDVRQRDGLRAGRHDHPAGEAAAGGADGGKGDGLGVDDATSLSHGPRGAILLRPRELRPRRRPGGPD
jgi:hypothetical protein